MLGFEDFGVLVFLGALGESHFRWGGGGGAFEMNGSNGIWAAYTLLLPMARSCLFLEVPFGVGFRVSGPNFQPQTLNPKPFCASRTMRRHADTITSEQNPNGICPLKSKAPGPEPLALVSSKCSSPEPFLRRAHCIGAWSSGILPSKPEAVLWFAFSDLKPF